MPREKTKIISIVGPTASGKSDFSIKIAKQFNGEIISADSRQIYKGLDIGSGKITKKEMANIPHHLLSICSPKKIFTVSDFKKLADKKIKELFLKKKTPIVCGGTGFYIDAILKNIILPNVIPNFDFRKKATNYGIEKLKKILSKLDPERYKNIDLNNKVRLIRAIEIAKSLGKVPKVKSKPIYKTLTIGILWPNEILKERINIRLHKRIEQGMIKEVSNLHKNGLSWKRMEALGLEYRYISLFLQKKITRQEMIEKLQNEIWHYAKRQITWFNRNKEIIWLKPSELKKAEKIIKNFLK